MSPGMFISLLGVPALQGGLPRISKAFYCWSSFHFTPLYTASIVILSMGCIPKCYQTGENTWIRWLWWQKNTICLKCPLFFWFSLTLWSVQAWSSPMADHKDRQLIFPGMYGKFSQLLCISYLARLLTLRKEARLVCLRAIAAQDIQTLRELGRPLWWAESFRPAHASARPLTTLWIWQGSFAASKTGTI